MKNGGNCKSNLLQAAAEEEVATTTTLSPHHRLLRFRKFSLAVSEMRNEIEAVTGRAGEEIETQGNAVKTLAESSSFKSD